MRRSYSATGLFIVGILLFSGFASPQVTQTLRFTVPELFFTAPTGLTNATTTAAGCGPTLGPTDQTASATFTWAIGDANSWMQNGSSWVDDLTTSADLNFQGPAPQPYRSTGFTVTVELRAGSTTIGNGSFAVPAGATAPQSATSVPIAKPAGTPIANGTSQISAIVTLTSSSAAPGQGVQLVCGTSSIDGFTVVRGQPGDGDLDLDGDPDSEDQDMDGDNVSNAQEAGIDCTIEGNDVDFSRSTAIQPGDHDGDGFTDERECAAGSDPLNALAVPEPPESLPWPLIISLFLLLVVIAAVVFFFTVYGKAAALSLVTASELVIPPGTQGKYQLVVQNLRKKGNPINFQLNAQGLPDGWDAKLQPDHAVLDPVGGAKNSENVWLLVEAPQHADPESAVVNVKAIALNAAGRKDTLKLPASVKTITSINVPPNAQVPVKRGAPVKIKSEKQLAKEAAAAGPAGEPTSVPVTAAAGEEEEAPAKGRKAKKGAAPAPPPAPSPAPAPAPAAAGTKPALQVGGLAHTPPSFAAGQDVKSMVTVTNNGAGPQTLKLSLFVNDALADAQTVSVKPGKSKEVKFKWTAQERNKLNIRGEVVGA